jgi:hypothetical protein
MIASPKAVRRITDTRKIDDRGSKPPAPAGFRGEIRRRQLGFGGLGLALALPQAGGLW